jgi:hypothetical protein
VSGITGQFPAPQEDCGGEVALKDPDTGNPLRTLPAFEKDRVNAQDGSTTMDCGLPSAGKVEGLASHPLTVTFALGAELLISMEIG